MKTIIISFLAILALLVVFSCSKSNNDNKNTGLTSQDSMFSVKASQGNIAEIEAGGVSIANSKNDSVKMFGQMMVTDHNMAKKSLDSIGDILNFTMPTETDSAHMAMKMKLMTLTGLAFDTTYVNGQVADHIVTLNLLNDEIINGTDARLKAYASKNYPIVQMHLNMAVDLQSKLKD